jgi:hypothetical protein
MKKAISVLALSIISFSAFSQAKKNEIENQGINRNPPKYSLTLNAGQWNEVFSWLQSSGKHTGAECVNMVDTITARLVLVPDLPKADSTKTKKP